MYISGLGKLDFAGAGFTEATSKTGWRCSGPWPRANPEITSRESRPARMQQIYQNMPPGVWTAPSVS
jgi:hypothetical protein